MLLSRSHILFLCSFFIETNKENHTYNKWFTDLWLLRLNIKVNYAPAVIRLSSVTSISVNVYVQPDNSESYFSKKQKKLTAMNNYL